MRYTSLIRRITGLESLIAIVSKMLCFICKNILHVLVNSIAKVINTHTLVEKSIAKLINEYNSCPALFFFTLRYG